MLNFHILKFTMQMNDFTFAIYTFRMAYRTNLTLIIYQFREIEKRMLKVMFARTFNDKYSKNNLYNYKNWSRCITDRIKKIYAEAIRRD